MYVAKGAGKDRVAAFDPGMHTVALKRLEMKADLQRAITEQELVLYYQPIVALVDGAVLGVEALVRWRHPQNGMITPADFIPVAEDSGLIIPLGKWVLTDACRQAAQWQTENPRSPSLGMSVNVSTAQLFHANFIEEVAAVVEASGLDPHALTLEITESGLMEDKEAAISKLKELRQLGVRVAVDDFGTGYSSLGYLSTLPIDVLKIDKMFIDGWHGGPRSLRSWVQWARLPTLWAWSWWQKESSSRSRSKPLLPWNSSAVRATTTRGLCRPQRSSL